MRFLSINEHMKQGMKDYFENTGKLVALWLTMSVIIGMMDYVSETYFHLSAIQLTGLKMIALVAIGLGYIGNKIRLQTTPIDEDLLRKRQSDFSRMKKEVERCKNCERCSHPGGSHEYHLCDYHREKTESEVKEMQKTLKKEMRKMIEKL